MTQYNPHKFLSRIVCRPLESSAHPIGYRSLGYCGPGHKEQLHRIDDIWLILDEKLRKNKEEREHLKQKHTRGNELWEQKGYHFLSQLVVCREYSGEAIKMAGAIFLWKGETDREAHSL